MTFMKPKVTIISIPSTPRAQFTALAGKRPDLLLTASRGWHKCYSFALGGRCPAVHLVGEFSAPGVGFIQQHLLGFSN